MKKLLSRIRFWIDCARWCSYAQSLIPALLTLLFVGGDEQFQFLPGILAVFGVVLAHTCANLLDDYFDFRCHSVQVREAMIDGGIRARAKKCYYLLSGETTLNRLLGVALFCGGLAAGIGLYLTLLRGPVIPIIAGIGAFLSFFYSAPPLRLSFHGLGELTVGLVFGPILMSGVAAAALGRFDATPLFFSVPIGLLVVNILYTHSILDLEPDRRAGKVTLAVALGNASRASLFSLIFMIAAYIIPIAGVMTGRLKWPALLVLLSIPLAVELFYLIRLYIKSPETDVQPKFWMGPMENWDKIEAAGVAWFSIRWLLSRNLMSAFCLLTAAAVLIERFFVK